MIIIETCPRCGHDLVDSMIYTYPPIPVKECPRCGWRYERTPEKVVRVPFNEDSYVTRVNTIVSSFDNNPCQRCNNNPKNGGSGFCACTLGQKGRFIYGY